MAKLLLVDDDSLLVRMYQTKLEGEGHQVETADNGLAMFEKLGEYKPDLVLLDVMMPQMNGLEALTKLKNTPSLKSIPVIMLTNVGSSEEDSRQALELGAVSYLVKSDYTPKEVVQKVKEILKGYTRELPQVKTIIKPAQVTVENL